MSKKRIVKDYDKLPPEIIAQVKMQYQSGFIGHLISYTDAKGKKVSALPFETDDIYYLIRMTALEAERIIEDDEDYDDDGNLRDDFSMDELETDTVDAVDTVNEDEDVDDSDEPELDVDEDEDDEN
ncbi:MAG: hypothetical protein ACK4K0_00710 [Flavobacteriales bacterium]